MLKRLLKDNFIRGTASLTAISLLGSFLNYLIHPFLARYLSVEQYGDFQAISSLVALVSIMSVVVSLAVAREVSVFLAQGQEGMIMSWQRRLSLKLWPYGLALFVVFASASTVLKNWLNISSAVALILVGLLFVYFLQTAIWRGILSGLQKFFWLSINSLQDGLFRFLFVLVFVVLLGWQLTGASLAIGLCFLPGLILGWYQIKACRLPVSGQDHHGLWSIFKYSWLVLVYTILTQLFFNLDMLMVKNLFSTEQAGFYGSLLTIGRIVFFIGGAVPAVMFPVLAGLGDQQHRRYKILGKSLLLTLGLIVPVGLIIGLFPEMVVKILVGAKYLSIVQYLPFFVIIMFCLIILTLLAQYFLALSDKCAPIILLVGLLLEVVLLIIRHGDFWQILWALLIAFGATIVGLLGLLVFSRAKPLTNLQISYESTNK